jgi:hypothetical protein
MRALTHALVILGNLIEDIFVPDVLSRRKDTGRLLQRPDLADLP